MKRITLSILVLFFCTTSLQAQITQEEADIIVLERMSAVMELYTIYALEDVQTSYEITTSIGEMLELDYPCWVYYADFKEKTNGKYLIGKESNGNLLEVNTKNDEGPEELEEWRMVDEIPFSIWKYTSNTNVIELIFYPSVHKMHIKPTPDPLPSPPYFFFTIDIIIGYYVEENKLYCVVPGTTLDLHWNITQISDNEMRLVWWNFLPAIYNAGYTFICQTEYTEI